MNRKEKSIEIRVNDPRMIAFQRLLNVMDDLREKCPWDKKQTIESLRHLTIEETYELADAITNNDMQEIEGELGDLFLHLVFYSKIGSELGAFDVSSVMNRICDKLVYRHPHIYGDVIAEDEATVKANWEKLKLQEGKKSVLEGVPSSLPALIKAMRIQEKVKGVGFDWDHIDQVKDKVIEEFSELHEALGQHNAEDILNEFGDVLFSLINYARFIGINPEDALEHTNRKFIARFKLMETMISEDKKNMQEMNLAQLDTYWNQAKTILKTAK
jgi:XTP/dITP diphosphohydrolase